MADIDVSAISGGGSLPRVASITAVKSSSGHITSGSALAIMNAGEPLATILDVTERCVISGLRISTTVAAAATVSDLIVTIDSDVKYSGAIAPLNAYQSIELLGRTLTVTTSVGERSSVFMHTSFECNSIKIEMATIGSANQLQVYGSLELIE